MTQTTDKINPEVSNTFPRSLLTVSREEFGRKEDNPDATQEPLRLLVKDDKTLPPDLQGHVFVIAPAGSVDLSCTPPGTKIVSPASDGATPMYNGDGIVYRLDFNNLAEGVTLTSRLMKTPCYYADVATNRCKEYQQPKNYRFESFGIVRFSEKLGLRNQVNTAFLPMQFSDAEGYRLLAAWDMGRPYEIDPQTLEAVTPIGKNTAWRPMNPLMADLPLQPPFPFPLVQSTAHPCFDFNTKQMFTVNAGKSIVAFIAQLRPIIYKAVDIVENIKDPVKRNLLFTKPASENVIEEQAPKTSFFDKLWFFIKKIVHFLYSLIQVFNIFNNFVYIVRWDGVNEPERWQVMLPNLMPLNIQQSMHQIGLTKDYVILIDTAFKTLVEELFPATKKQKYIDLEKLLRKLWDRPQLPETYLYLVRRDELQAGKKRVKASKLVIPRETTHFVLDYENPNQQITLHLAHMSAWDVAEWIRDIDDPVFPTKNSAAGKQEKLFGLILSPLDINLMASYVIDAADPKDVKVIRSDFSGAYKEFTSNKSADKDGNDYSQYSWGHSLFTCLDNQPQGRLEDIYWSSVGCWKELMTQYSVNLYENYKYRKVPIKEVLKITQDGVQSNLLRLHIHPLENLPPNQNRLEIQDGYQFPNNWFGTSPQFIPRAGGTGNSTDGYIVCMVHYGNGNEPDNGNQIWIFDAANLKGGPICQLWHPQLKMGFTVHTTWLPKIAKRTASYNVDVEEDYQDLVAKQPEEIQELFKKWVYQKKEPPMDCKC